MLVLSSSATLCNQACQVWPQRDSWWLSANCYVLLSNRSRGPVKSPERRKAAADHKAVCRVLARKRAVAAAAAARMAAAEPEAERGLEATGPATTARLAARSQGSRRRKAGAAGPAGRQVCLAAGSVPG